MTIEASKEIELLYFNEHNLNVKYEKSNSIHFDNDQRVKVD